MSYPMVFEEFPKISRLDQYCYVTEKIHGTNAQIFITEDESLPIYAGSRSRWLSVDDDNHGFARFVVDNADAIRVALGPGRHFGEWYGVGIGSGYGLKEKRLALFNSARWTGPAQGGKLPPRVDVVPILYQGPYTHGCVDAALDLLRNLGSQIPAALGFPRPEGVVVYFKTADLFLKRPFVAEDTPAGMHWAAGVRPQTAKGRVDHAAIDAICAPFWQPIRLEKLLVREERFTSDWPVSLPDLVSAYVRDLFEETTDVPEDTARLVRKQAFNAVKTMMSARGHTSGK